jgi:adenylosuccinate synthase
MIADVVVGLQFGDEGKGKVTHQLAKNGNYTHVVRYNGGCNAGHTIFHKGHKFVTHHIPCGVFFGIRSIIGPGCVINVKKLFDEIEYLEKSGIKVRDLLKIASNAHIITDFHQAEDSKDTLIGTTRTGNGPAYRDKYARRGVRAIECVALEEFIIDMYTELHENPEFEEVCVLCEGAQGFGLDIDWGDYPFVTSSHCTTSGAISNGIPHTSIRDVWGVAKVYETYVGAKSFENDEKEIFGEIRDAGSEFGATTGRPRQVDWMTLEMLQRALKLNGVTKAIFNKADILEKVGVWSVYSGMDEISFKSSDDMEAWLSGELEDYCDFLVFSRSPDKI